MTRKLFIMCAALVWTATLMAQNIAVVNGNNTDLYRTLAEAIEGAAPNSVIYLPGGGFPISDEVKITKKLTIIGIGHKSNNDNVDGVTTINGNLFFNQGSSGSAILGCYITGNVCIGEGEASVNDMLIRYCNLNSVQVKNSTCVRININQNYIRSVSDFGMMSNVIISHNITSAIQNVGSGNISNNIVLGGLEIHNYYNNVWSFNIGMSSIYSSIIDSNIFKFPLTGWYTSPGGGYTVYSCNDCQGSNNYGANWGDKQIEFEAGLADVFVNWNNGVISPSSDFHFKDEYKQYENQVGIYAGEGFNDKQLAPVPYIVAKQIDEQTDASGKLNIKVRVKAGE